MPADDPTVTPGTEPTPDEAEASAAPTEASVGAGEAADPTTRDGPVETGPVEAPASSETAPARDAEPAPAPRPATEPTHPPGPAPRRRRTGRLVALVAATALVIASGLVALTSSSIFAAEEIRVRGIDHLTKAEILRLSGLERGVNVFRLDAVAVEERIERDPWVARATVTKELPSTLLITIRERDPVAVVNDGTVERLVGDDGALLDVGAPAALPRIVAGDGATTSDPNAVRGAALAVAAMRPAVRALVALIVLLPDGELALELRSGVPVTYGDADDTTSKAQALAAMLRYAERSGTRYVSMDVSAPTAPAGTLSAA